MPTTRSCTLTRLRVHCQCTRGTTIQANMRALTKVGVPYSAADIEKAAQAVKGKTEMEALIAYLQMLGTGYDPASTDHGGH